MILEESLSGRMLNNTSPRDVTPLNMQRRKKVWFRCAAAGVEESLIHRTCAWKSCCCVCICSTTFVSNECASAVHASARRLSFLTGVLGHSF